MVAGRLPVLIKGGRTGVVDLSGVQESWTPRAMAEPTDPGDPMTPVDATTPGPPTNLRLTGVATVTSSFFPGVVFYDESNLRLFWDAPSSDGGAPITDYQIEFRSFDEDVPSSQSGSFSETTRTPFVGGPVTVWTDWSNILLSVGNFVSTGARYTMRMRALNEHGAGGWSGTLTLQNGRWTFEDQGGGITPPIATEPGIPTGLIVSAGDTTVDISWSEPDDGGEVTGYDLQYRDRASLNDPWSAWTDTGYDYTITPMRSFEHTGLTNNREYQYQIRATGPGGEGLFTEPSNVVTPTAAMIGEAPGVPTNLQVIAGDDELQIVWDRPTTGGEPDDYDLQYREDTGPFTQFGPAMDIPFTSAVRFILWAGATNGNRYQIRVRASNIHGTSAWSDWEPTNGVIPSPDPPTGPRNLSASAGDGHVDIMWEAPSGGGQVIAYELQYEEAVYNVSADRFDVIVFFTNGSLNLGGGTPLSYSHTTVTNGNFYRYRVRARAAGDQNFGPWTTMSRDERVQPRVTVVSNPPGRVPKPGAVAGNESIQVTWTPPSDGGPVLNYDIQVQDSSSTQIPPPWQDVATVGVTPTSYTHTGRTNGVGYRYRVRATNNDGDGEWSPESDTVTPMGVPGTPERPTMTSARMRRPSLAVFWLFTATGVAPNPAGDSYEWEVQRERLNFGTWGSRVTYRTVDDDLTWTREESANSNITYRFRARFRGRSNAGAGSYSPFSLWHIRNLS